MTLSDDQQSLEVQSASSLVPSELEIAIIDDRHIRLSGDAGDQRISATLRRIDRDDFLLVNRGFHWINEFPFNR